MIIGIFFYIYSKLILEDKYGEISTKDFISIYCMLGLYFLIQFVVLRMPDVGVFEEWKPSLIAVSSPILAFTLVAIQEFYNNIQVEKYERFLRELKNQNSQMSNEFSDLHEKLINEIKSLKEDIKKLH